MLRRSTFLFSITVNPAEVCKFGSHNSSWWAAQGKISGLHELNPCRLAYIKQMMEAYGDCTLKRAKILDVGCGGGILSESLARSGATVTGLDASKELITAARAHKDLVDTSNELRLNYKCETVEEELEKYDLVVASEVIEHVDAPEQFIKALCARIRPVGLLIISTMDKTALTYFSHIFMAECALGIVPKGSHDWTQFIPPKDFSSHCSMYDVFERDITHLVGVPDLPASVMAGQTVMRFSLSKKIKTGHYLWTGVKGKLI